MSTLDIVFCAVIAVMALLGLKRGFIGELFRFVALLGGFVVAYLGYGLVVPKLAFLRAPENVRAAVAFVFIFLVAASLLLLIGWVLKKVVHLVMLGWVDRLLGACVGAAKALVVIWVTALGLAALPGQGTASLRADSYLCRSLARIPLTLSLPSAGGTGSSGDTPPIEKIKAAKRAFLSFRVKADSLKALKDRHSPRQDGGEVSRQ